MTEAQISAHLAILIAQRWTSLQVYCAKCRIFGLFNTCCKIFGAGCGGSGSVKITYAWECTMVVYEMSIFIENEGFVLKT